MKSTSGKYYQSLDHIRAIAAYSVFTWHFIHFNNGQLEQPLFFPLSFLTEGHTGVGLFMTLSGYLFAKLLNGKKIAFKPFLWNRFIRLFPLLIFVIIIHSVRKIINNTFDISYLYSILGGIVFPSLPNGGWSITSEFHFYMILPLLIFLSNKNNNLLLIFLVISFLTRVLNLNLTGETQNLAYYTIFGRIDQFILGIYVYKHKEFFKNKNLLFIISTALFLMYLYYFDLNGGFYNHNKFPSDSFIWTIMTTIEGAAYSIFIAWYDSNYKYRESKLHTSIALIGQYSYSIYLLHFFFVLKMANIIDKYIFRLDNSYLILLFSVPCFIFTAIISHFSYNYIEKPFLKHRKKYILI